MNVNLNLNRRVTMSDLQIGLFEVVSVEDKYKEWIVQDLKKRKPLNYGALLAVVEKYQDKVNFSVYEYLRTMILSNKEILRTMKPGTLIMIYHKSDQSPNTLIRDSTEDYPSYMYNAIDDYYKKDLGGCYIVLHGDDPGYASKIRTIFEKMNRKSPV